MRAARHAIWRQGCAALPVRGTDLEIPCAHQYQHLGGIISHDGSLAPEVRHRVAEARTALAPPSRVGMRKPKVNVHTKVVFGESLVLPRLSFNVGTWPRPPASVEKDSHAVYTNLYRSAAHMRFSRATSTQANAKGVYTQVQKLDPDL